MFIWGGLVEHTEKVSLSREQSVCVSHEHDDASLETTFAQYHIHQQQRSA